MWFYLALGSALVSALTVIIGKKILASASPLVLIWTTFAVSTPFISILSIAGGIPRVSPLFYVGVFGSVVLYVVARKISYGVIQVSHLSAVYPLTALGPIFTLIVASFPPLLERPSALAIFGVCTTLFGTYVLNVSALKEGLLKPFKLLLENKLALLMMLSVFIISIVSVFDKLAITSTEPRSPIFTILIENLLIIVGLFPIIRTQNKNFFSEVKMNVRLLLLMGCLDAAGSAMAFTALGSASVALATTIVKLQALFVLIFSFAFFKDRPKFETIAGTVIMLTGVVLIKLGA